MTNNNRPYLNYRLLYIPIAFLFILSFVNCAKKGTPSGGVRDTIPPVIVRSIPENFSTNFSGNEIEIRFNEYIKLKDINQQLIISPPMKYRPVITPLSTAKSLKIKIIDTLEPNTTYSFNFGKSIVDNNEGNEFKYFKYVFSTGSYIDSLTVSGRVRDAKLVAPEIPTTVMLYKMDGNFKDSLVYSAKPTYITVTADTTGVFELTNLKQGKYRLIALNEKGSDYTFQPKTDKIGYVNDPVYVPTDSLYTITLFKETPGYKLARPAQVGNNHIIFGFEGEADSLKIDLLSDKPSDFKTIVYKDEIKDTLNYWYKPAIALDSLVFKVANGKVVDTVTLRMKALYTDSLKISAVKTGTLKLRDTFKLRANTPILSFAPEKFRVMTRDSLVLEPAVTLNTKYNITEISFPKKEEEIYSISIMPGALTDFFDHTNDSLTFKINTRSASEYGTLQLHLVNVDRYPLIVQMVDSKFDVVASKIIPKPLEGEKAKSEVTFEEIAPAKYYLRIIYDDNANGRWDTGNFLNRVKPEKILYYPSIIEIRANWNLNETFILK